MEFKVGAYRTAWGVANGVSVVDTINPLDIEDPTRFDRRLSVPSATLTAHWETFSASGIVIPFFVPAALPAVPVSVMSGATDLIDERIIGGDETTIGDLASRPVVPNDSLAETTLGIRLRWTASAGDFALSWHHGRDSLPQVNGDLLLVGYQTNNDKVDVGIPLTYPRMDVLGFTARAPIGVGIVGWLETAVVFPEATAASPSAAQLDGLVKLGTIDEMPNPIPTTVTQDGKPLARWILGADRPIGPVRLTAQWMHGFFTERSQSSLNDYALMGVQITLGETVRLDTKAATTSKGHLADISLRYLHDDAVDIKVGGTHIDGDNNSAFGGLRAASNLYTRVSLKF